MHQLSSSRAGNTLALVMALAIAGMGAVYISSQAVMDRVESGQTANYQSLALGALEGVLTRHEASIVRLAETGDPDGFANMHDNYGEETLGNCRVRWKIEPAIIRQPAPVKSVDGDADGYADAEANDFRKYIFNPLPTELPDYKSGTADLTGDNVWNDADRERLQSEFTASQDGAASIQNDFLYVYRVSGESQYLPGGDEWDHALQHDRALASVQAVRYVAITKQPVFRYVIFYAQEGPKGDLEFCHRTPMNVRGSVQCNSSIYMGGNLLVNTWSSLGGPLGATTIGPDADGASVRVNGVNGVFRLDKKAVFSHINGWMPAAGNPGVSSTLAGFYDAATGATYPGEEGGEPAYGPPAAGATLLDVTWGGRLFNPNRIKDDKIATQFGVRTINGDEIRGIELDPAYPANDARRAGWRANALKQAPIGFGGFARSRVNGGGVLRIPPLLGNRAFEAQAVLYEDYDGDPAQEEHELAKPLFIHNTSLLRTVEMPPEDGDIVEAPGRYISFGLGTRSGEADQFFFRRRNEMAYAENGFATPADPGVASDQQDGLHYNGWDVVRRVGTDWQRVGTDASYAAELVGLVIRERPQPDLSYYNETIAGDDDFYYLPYAYGKWNRAAQWPLWEMDVVATRSDTGNKVIDAGINVGFDNYINTYSDWFHWNRNANANRYVSGGRYKMEAAMFPGPDGRTNWNSDGNDSVNWWGDPGDTPPEDEFQDGWSNINSGLRHYPDYYRENWRFAHVNRPEMDTTRTGLLIEYYNGSKTFRGTPVRREVGYNLVNWGSAAPYTGGPTDGFSIRWTGFIKAPESGSYRFYHRADEGVRVWIDGELVVDDWSMQNMSATPELGATKLLQKDAWYPIVIEYFENSDSAQGVLVYWKPPSATGPVELSTASLRPPKDATLNLADLDAIQLRVTGFDGHDRRKAGLMIRAVGATPLTTSNPLPLPTTDTMIQDPVDGTFRIEAEAFSSAFTSTASPTGRAWWTSTSLDASQGAYISTTDSGQSFGTGSMHTGARVQYNLKFDVAGTYRVDALIRRGTGDSASDQFYAGIKNAVDAWAATHFSSSSQNTAPSGVAPFNFGWVGLAFTGSGAGYSTAGSIITVTVPGIYHLGLAMADDGVQVDRLVVRPSGMTDSPDLYPGTTEGGSGRRSPFVPGAAPAEFPALGHLADGRDAYAAILYSPERGVFMQYRGATAASVTQTVTKWFVGSKAGAPVDPVTGEALVEFDSGETGIVPTSLPAPRTVSLIPSLESSTVTGTPNVEDNGTVSDDRRRQQMTSPVRKVESVNNGGGDTYQMMFWQGPIKRRVYREARAKYEKTTTVRWRFTLETTRDSYNGANVFDGQDFITDTDANTLFGNTALSDKNKRIQMYYGVSDNALVWDTTLDDDDWSVNRDYLVRWWQTRTNLPAGLTPGPLYSNSGDHYFGPRASSADWSTGGTQYGDGNSVWWGFNEGGDIRTPKSGQTLAGINAAMDYLDPACTEFDGWNSGDSRFDNHGTNEYIEIDAATGNLASEAANLGRRLDYRPRKILPIPYDPVNPNNKVRYYNTYEEFLFDLVIARGGGLAVAQGLDAVDAVGATGLPGSDGVKDSVGTARVADAEALCSVNKRTSAAWPWASCGNSTLVAAPTVADPAASGAWPTQCANKPSGRQPTDPVTFSVQRTRYVHIDVNSYVTRWGKWFQPFVVQHRPYPSWSALIPPSTGGFRPEQWYAGDWNAAGPAKGAARKILPPMSGNRRLDAPWQDDITEWSPGVPFVLDGVNDLWLRIERASGSRYRLGYYFGNLTAPGASDFQIMKDQAGNEIQLDLALLGSRVLAGPCMQSGHKDWVASYGFRDLSVDFAPGTGNTPIGDPDLLDFRDYEKPDATGASRDSRYLASQYQVFWGPYEITEDFFTWRDGANGDSLLANEDWIYNTREFGSQSRWWDCGLEKEDQDLDGDPEPTRLFPQDVNLRCTRELLAKQTILSLDMKSVQNYLKQRNISEATAHRMVGGYEDADNMLVTSLTGAYDTTGDGRSHTLADHFNGLVYAVRCNRYPWNPNIDPQQQVQLAADDRGANSWTWPLRMPNETPVTAGVSDLAFTGEALLAIADPVARRAAYQELRYGTPGGGGENTRWPRDGGTGLTTWRAATEALIDINTHPIHKINGDAQELLPFDNGVKAADTDERFYALQPYALANAPAFRPTQFAHAVRVKNFESVDWGLPNQFSGQSLTDVPDFGDSKSIVVTPNQLMLQGDVNTMTYTAKVNNLDSPDKITPVAVVGDAITMLSNAWDDEPMQDQGLVVDAATRAVLGGGSLSRPWGVVKGLPNAVDTTYNTSIITHNQPTTRESVRDGEAAAIGTVLFYLENWLYTGSPIGPADMNFAGSLVVMDSRRTCEAYLIDLTKIYGRSPFGTMGWHVGQGFHEDRLHTDYATRTDLAWGTTGVTSLSSVYREANQIFDFNPDLLTAAGTPPFTPFGVTATGTGAWINYRK